MFSSIERPKKNGKCFITIYREYKLNNLLSDRSFGSFVVVCDFVGNRLKELSH